MENKVPNTLGSERTVETIFIEEAIKKYYKVGDKIIDIGGVPTNDIHLANFQNYIEKNNIDFKVSDFRTSDFQGDFVKYDFKDKKFDIGIFLSSLEHFPQCTESDRVFREGYDRQGYQKALNILNKDGLIILTVPFGKHRWQPYHQNYNWEGILKLTEGSTIIEHYIYKLNTQDDIWEFEQPENMEEVLYTDKAHGVGLFILKKD